MQGAMENKSLNIFNSRLVLASPETATDYDYKLNYDLDSAAGTDAANHGSLTKAGNALTERPETVQANRAAFSFSAGHVWGHLTILRAARCHRALRR